MLTIAGQFFFSQLIVTPKACGTELVKKLIMGPIAPDQIVFHSFTKNEEIGPQFLMMRIAAIAIAAARAIQGAATRIVSVDTPKIFMATAERVTALLTSSHPAAMPA